MRSFSGWVSHPAGGCKCLLSMVSICLCAAVPESGRVGAAFWGKVLGCTNCAAFRARVGKLSCGQWSAPCSVTDRIVRANPPLPGFARGRLRRGTAVCPGASALVEWVGVRRTPFGCCATLGSSCLVVGVSVKTVSVSAPDRGAVVARDDRVTGVAFGHVGRGRLPGERTAVRDVRRTGDDQASGTCMGRSPTPNSCTGTGKPSRPGTHLRTESARSSNSSRGVQPRRSPGTHRRWAAPKTKGNLHAQADETGHAAQPQDGREDKRDVQREGGETAPARAAGERKRTVTNGQKGNDARGHQSDGSASDQSDEATGTAQPGQFTKQGSRDAVETKPGEHIGTRTASTGRGAFGVRRASAEPLNIWTFPHPAGSIFFAPALRLSPVQLADARTGPRGGRTGIGGPGRRRKSNSLVDYLRRPPGKAKAPPGERRGFGRASVR